MKKTLVTLAVMSAISGSVMAQNVQLYGTVDVGIENVNSGGVSTTTMGPGSVYTPSFIGIKGTEELGNGLQGKFVLEQGFDVSTGAQEGVNQAFSRQSWLGLSSKEMGEVRLGKQYTPIRNIVEAVDPFRLGLTGSSLNVLAGGLLGQAQTLDNAVTYVSPTVGGLTGSVQYGLGETAGSTSANTTWGGSVAYSNGPLLVGAALMNAKRGDGVVQDDKADAWVLGGTYDFGAAKAHFAYAETKLEDRIANSETKLKNVHLGVSKTMGAHTVLASWNRNEVSDLANSTTDQYAIGYEYGLSKRTALYTSYAYVKNDSNVGLAGAAGNGENVNRYNFGVKHSF